MNDPGLSTYMKRAAEMLHPTEAEWYDLAAGRVTPAERGRLEGHREACAVCREIYQDAVLFAAPVAAPAPPMSPELRQAVDAVGMAQRLRFTLVAPTSIAAGLAAVISGGIVWQAANRETSELRARLESTREAIAALREEAAVSATELQRFKQANPVVATLYPSGSVLRSGTGQNAMVTPARATMLLALGEVPAAGPFQIQLHRGRELVRQWHGVSRTAEGDIRLLVTGLEPGVFAITLSPGQISYSWVVK